MFAAPAPVVFMQWPLSNVMWTFSRAILDAIVYYGESKSDHAAIVTTRLLHLWSLKFRSTHTRQPTGMNYIETPFGYSVQFLAQVWRLLRSKEVGLCPALISAVEHVKLSKRPSFKITDAVIEEQDKRHSRIAKNLRESFDSLEALFMGPDEGIDAAENDCLELIRAHAEAGHCIEEYERKDANISKVDMVKYVVPCEHNIDALCAEPDYAPSYPKKANLATGDDALETMCKKICAANKKASAKQMRKRELFQLETEAKPSIKAKRLADS